jgi:predicted  nucleic acid-binding Zn-ribbon protein
MYSRFTRKHRGGKGTARRRASIKSKQNAIKRAEKKYATLKKKADTAERQFNTLQQKLSNAQNKLDSAYQALTKGANEVEYYRDKLTYSDLAMTN